MDYWERPYHRQPQRFHMFGAGERFSPGVKWLIILNVAVYLLEILFLAGAQQSGNTGGAWERFVWTFGLAPSFVFSRGYLWQLVTYSFVHDTGIFHILFNMLFLYWFGRSVEGVWGTKRFLLFYVGGAVFAGILYSLVHAIRPSPPCIGASGAVMAVMMVYALWFPNQMILFMLIFPMRIRTFIMLLIVMETVGWLNPTGNVANMAHLGGLLYGYLVVRSAPGLTQFTSRRRGRERVSGEDDEQRLDDILEKIRRDGIGSLRWGEKRFLKKMSRR